MSVDLNAHKLDIPCPHCGHKISKTIGQLRPIRQLTCTGCRKSFSVDAHQLDAGIKKAEQTLADFARRIGRLGK